MTEHSEGWARRYFFKNRRRQKSLLSVFVQLLQWCLIEVVATYRLFWCFSWAKISERFMWIFEQAFLTNLKLGTEWHLNFLTDAFVWFVIEVDVDVGVVDQLSAWMPKRGPIPFGITGLTVIVWFGATATTGSGVVDINIGCANIGEEGVSCGETGSFSCWGVVRKKVVPFFT